MHESYNVQFVSILRHLFKSTKYLDEDPGQNHYDCH